MSGHSVVRFERWTLGPDLRADAEPATYAMQCTACRRTSKRSPDFEEIRRWAANHTARNTLHTTFRRIAHTPYLTRHNEGPDT